MSKELKTKESQELQALIEDNAGLGLEQADSECYRLPILMILQDLSKAVKEHLPGIQPGKIYDTVTGEAFEKVTIAPIFFQRQWIEWIDRKQGGGLVQIHNRELPGEQDENGIIILDNGHHLIDTRIHYVLLINDEQCIPAMMAMSSTQIKFSKLWCALMKRQVGRKLMADGSVQVFEKPSFSTLYDATTKLVTNAKGSWYTWSITLSQRAATAEQFKLAKMYYDEFASATNRYDNEGSFAQADEQY